MALLQGAHGVQGGLGPAHQVVCKQGRSGEGRSLPGTPSPCRGVSQGGLSTLPGEEERKGPDSPSARAAAPTWGAGAAQVQGVVELGHSVLQDALGLGGRAPQHLELLVQEPPPELLFLRLLVREGRGSLEALPQGGRPLGPARRPED